MAQGTDTTWGRDSRAVALHSHCSCRTIVLPRLAVRNTDMHTCMLFPCGVYPSSRPFSAATKHQGQRHCATMGTPPSAAGNGYLSAQHSRHSARGGWLHCTCATHRYQDLQELVPNATTTRCCLSPNLALPPCATGNHPQQHTNTAAQRHSNATANQHNKTAARQHSDTAIQQHISTTTQQRSSRATK